MNASDRSSNTGVAAAVRRFAGRVTEDERDGADKPEDDEVRPLVLEVRVELPTQEQRNETDEREDRGQHGREDSRERLGLDPLPDARRLRFLP
jgi:hypothetical protein